MIFKKIEKLFVKILEIKLRQVENKIEKLIERTLHKETLYEELSKLEAKIPLLINQALSREIIYEDGTTEIGKVIERKVNENAIDFMCKYTPRVEAAIRGMQADINKTNTVTKLLADAITIDIKKETIKQIKEK